MSYIGIKGARRLDETDTSLGLIEAHDNAVSMLRHSHDMHFIKLKTGWELGVDGKWRYEIDDPFHNTAEIEDYVKRHFGESIDIRYCMRDTTLLNAYSAFEKLKLYALYKPTKKESGYFDPDRYSMMVCMGTQNSPFEYQIEGILLHELQHLIQEEENFARGGSGSYYRYMRLAGEVESRNICTRHFLTPEQRRAKLRSDTQDVPDDDQIVLFHY